LGLAAAFAFLGLAAGVAAGVAVALAAVVAVACRPRRFGRVAGSDPRTDASDLAERLALFFAVLVLAGLSLIGLVWDARSDDLGVALW
jgi:low temperature requirement protein LtrA